MSWRIKDNSMQYASTQKILLKDVSDGYKQKKESLYCNIN